jgi:hypothetical protein
MATQMVATEGSLWTHAVDQVCGMQGELLQRAFGQLECKDRALRRYEEVCRDLKCQSEMKAGGRGKRLRSGGSCLSSRRLVRRVTFATDKEPPAKREVAPLADKKWHLSSPRMNLGKGEYRGE